MIGILRCDPPLRTKPIRIDFPPNTSPVKKPRIRPRKRLAGTKTGQNRFRSPAPISPKALLRAFSVSDPDTMAGASDNANRKPKPRAAPTRSVRNSGRGGAGGRSSKMASATPLRRIGSPACAPDLRRSWRGSPRRGFRCRSRGGRG